MSDEKLKLEKKLDKVHHGFADMVNGLNVKDLEANLLLHSKYREDTLSDLANNKKIKDAQEQVKELKGPYQDMINALKLKTAYINILIRERTGQLSAEEKAAAEEDAAAEAYDESQE